MINIPCEKCGGTDICKNGLTKARAQKYHCKSCCFYGTLVIQEKKQKMKEALIEKPLRERVSQRGITRLADVSRCRMISVIKKKKFRPLHQILLKGKNVRLWKQTNYSRLQDRKITGYGYGSRQTGTPGRLSEPRSGTGLTEPV
ncbi:hypothetical protein QUF90_12995 [Desulfococcaceae bacterium HSG9]|nr:hypothetical protein [Desulfococcaceae bacterium HSG9]